MAIPSVFFRNLNPQDLESVFRIAQGALVPVWSPKDYDYFLSRKDSLNVGLFCDEQLASFILTLKTQDELDIIAIATATGFQKKGLATQLVNQVREESKVGRITLEVDQSNESAVKLYLKCGFQIKGLRKKYYEGKRDAWLMVWERT